MKYTEEQFKEAKILVLKKWQWVIDNWDGKLGDNNNRCQLTKDIPELAEMKSACAFCNLMSMCELCPIVLFYNKTEICYVNNSTYNNWKVSKTKANARKMYKLLEKITWEGIK